MKTINKIIITYALRFLLRNQRLFLKQFNIKMQFNFNDITRLLESIILNENYIQF